MIAKILIMKIKINSIKLMMRYIEIHQNKQLFNKIIYKI